MSPFTVLMTKSAKTGLKFLGRRTRGQEGIPHRLVEMGLCLEQSYLRAQRPSLPLPSTAASSLPARTFLTSRSSPAAQGPALLAQPTPQAVATGTAATPVGSVASAPAGRCLSQHGATSPIPVHRDKIRDGKERRREGKAGKETRSPQQPCRDLQGPWGHWSTQGPRWVWLPAAKPLPLIRSSEHRHGSFLSIEPEVASEHHSLSLRTPLATPKTDLQYKKSSLCLPCALRQ